MPHKWMKHWTKNRAVALKFSLLSWENLNLVITFFTEQELKTLLEVERANKRRPNMLKRLHQRLNALRVRREREELRKNP